MFLVNADILKTMTVFKARMENFTLTLNFFSSYFMFVLILWGNIYVSHCVEIRRLSVPRWVQNGTEDSVVLDCEYVYNENDFRLVVKWFFEDNLEPVYQWIPELNRRHTSGVLKDRLDMDFTVNTADAYSRFRALRIPRPSTELSGKYTCLVTSLAGQDSREQIMTVFVPANEFELSYTELNDASVNVTCEALGLFPNPILKLHLRSSNGSPPQLITNTKSYSRQKSTGAFDAYMHRTFSANELTKNGASVFECSLELPGTNYVKAKRIAYFPGIQGHRLNAPYSLSSLSFIIPPSLLLTSSSAVLVWIISDFQHFNFNFLWLIL